MKRLGFYVGILAWLGCLLLDISTAFAAPAAINAAAVHVEVGESTKLIFDLSAPVAATSYVLSDPDRIIIDVPEVHFLMPVPNRARPQGRRGQMPQNPAQGVIAAYRFGSFAQGRSRIVIDLATAAKIQSLASLPHDKRWQLTIELAPTDRAHFLADAAQGRAALASAAPSPLAPLPLPATQPRPVIVIDAGHGGIDTGAQSPDGVNEKDVVFAFAKKLVARLELGDKYKIVMTRSTDVFIPLSDRVRMARAANASLFLSIHADTLSDDEGVTGATVYTASDRASDAEAARVAEKENQADLAGGLDRREDQGDVNDILFDLTRRETRSYSHVFADALITLFGTVGRLNKNPKRSAGFVVLKAPDVPSVLLELGYLSNARDVSNLTQPEWQDKAVAAVAKAIDRFIAAHMQNGGDISPNSVLMGLGKDKEGE